MNLLTTLPQVAPQSLKGAESASNVGDRGMSECRVVAAGICAIVDTAV